MNENKTAITELIEWMENVVAQEPLSNNHISHGKMAMYNLIIDKARALESSQAERDKGLVEELKKEIRSRSYSYENDECNTQVIPVGDLLKILSRHTPKPKDEGGLIGDIVAVMTDNKKHGDKDYEAQIWQIQAMIDRHPIPTTPDRQEALDKGENK